MNIALFLSGGTGTRLGTNIPKQYLKVSGRPVFSYCLETLLTHPLIDRIQIVADPMWRDEICGWFDTAAGERAESENDLRASNPRGSGLWIDKFGGFSLPGRTRQMSIYNGLEDIRKYARDADYILIHDAARPLLSPAQITDCLEGAAGHDGAMPVLPMKDTVYLSYDGRSVGKLLDRGRIYGGQAPEVFVLGAYFEANTKLLPQEILKINGSTEPAVMAGMDIAMIPGDEGNFKITTKEDLERFCGIVEKEISK